MQDNIPVLSSSSKTINYFCFDPGGKIQPSSPEMSEKGISHKNLAYVGLQVKLQPNLHKYIVSKNEIDCLFQLLLASCRRSNHAVYVLVCVYVVFSQYSSILRTAWLN